MKYFSHGIQIVSAMAIGWILAGEGYGIFTWQFWVVMVLVGTYGGGAILREEHR